MSTAYRSAYDHIVGLKLAETDDARVQLAPLMPGVRKIAGKRMARMVAGTIGITGALAMVGFAISGDSDSYTTLALLGSSLALVCSWAFGRSIAAIVARFRKTKSISLALSGVLDADLATIEASDPRAELARIKARADDLEAPSIWLPASAMALLLPLLTHFAFASIIGMRTDTDGFDQWIRVSLIIVGHAHIALVVLIALFAKKVKKMSTEELATFRIHREWAKIWLIVIGISCLPGIILYLIPPLIVAVTGLATIPLIILLLYKAVLSERTELAFGEAAARVRVADAPVAVGEWLAKEQERESGRDHEDADRDADDSAEREPLLAASHRSVDGGARG